MMRMKQKLIAILQSKRFYATVAVAIFIIAARLEQYQHVAQSIAQIVGAWVVGDSIRPDNVLESRRFWLMIGSVVAVLLSSYGAIIPMELLQELSLSIGAWIIGDALRKTRVKRLR